MRCVEFEEGFEPDEDPEDGMAFDGDEEPDFGDFDGDFDEPSAKQPQGKKKYADAEEYDDIVAESAEGKRKGKRKGGTPGRKNKSKKHRK